MHKVNNTVTTRWWLRESEEIKSAEWGDIHDEK